MKLLQGTMILALLMTTWNEIANFRRVPLPQSYMHVVWIWLLLGLLAEFGPDVGQIAGVFSVGLLISMAYVYFQTGTPLLATTGPTTQGVA